MSLAMVPLKKIPVLNVWVRCQALQQDDGKPLRLWQHSLVSAIVVHGIVGVPSDIFDFMRRLRRFQSSDIGQRRIFNPSCIMYVSLAVTGFADVDAGC